MWCTHDNQQPSDKRVVHIVCHYSWTESASRREKMNKLHASNCYAIVDLNDDLNGKGTYCRVNNKNSAMSSTYHSGSAVNLHVTS